MTIVLQALFAVMLLAQMPAGAEWAQIDGKKNPEMVPQWHTWDYVFRAIANGPEGKLPTIIHEEATPEDIVALFKEARAQEKRRKEVEAKVTALATRLDKEKREVLIAENDALVAEFRAEIITARDRVLGVLSPAARIAAVQYAESTKTSVHISVPKAQLNAFRQPE